MKFLEWGRLFTAMVTPFREDGSIDYQMAQKLAIYLVENGSDGIVVNGTTGESPTTTASEKAKLLETVLEAVGDRATIIAGTGNNSTADSISLTKEATEIGAHGIMLVTPYYNKPPQEGLKEHFTQVAKSTRLPVMLYNVPGRTSVNLLPSTVEKLAQVPNIVAIKEASGNLDQVTDILRKVPESFRVYSGDDSLTLPVLSLGGYGIVSVASHIVGTPMKKMIDMHVSGDVMGASKAHRHLFPIFRGLFMTTSPIPVKKALDLIGYQVGNTRWPLGKLEAHELETLKNTMKAMELI